MNKFRMDEPHTFLNSIYPVPRAHTGDKQGKIVEQCAKYNHAACYGEKY